MIASGTRLGPYQVVSKIGAGGMGEVWRAVDTRLERSVAIKVLPKEFAGNAQLRTRFEREARTISQLTHPNICTLHDVGHVDGTDFLVMELLEGETLADRLARGPLPLSEVIRVGTQIAEALERAHKAGVIHRDLKPANVMLTRSGAKLLDFGLAKSGGVYNIAPGDATQQKPLTQEGTIVGTFQYMAPEQLEGLDADARTDIFALGALLYEMATGRRAFEGQTRTSLVAAIVSAEPKPMAELQPLTPAPLEQLIRACLAKDPDDRIQTAHDVALHLKWISTASTPSAATAAAGTRGRRRTAVVAAVAALLALAAAYGAYRYGIASAPRPLIRFSVAPPSGANYSRTLAVSPDGRTVVAVNTDDDGKLQLWMRGFDAAEARPVPGTQGAMYPFWSPDGRYVGFFADRKLKKIELASGTVGTICDAGSGGGASWGEEGAIVFAPHLEGTLWRVSATGGDPVEITRHAAGETHHLWPAFLPGGNRYLYSIAGGAAPGVYVGTLGSSEKTRVLPYTKLDDISATAYGDGYLFYVKNRSLLAQKFDAASARLEGTPIRLADGLDVTGPGRTSLSVAGGALVYAKGAPLVMSQLTWMDRSGRELGTIGPPAPYREIDLSRDGRRLAAQRIDGQTDPGIWIVDAMRGSATRFSTEYYGASPSWSPDGSAIAFSSARELPPNVYVRRLDGTEEAWTALKQQVYAGGWTPDGNSVIASVNRAEATKNDICVVSRGQQIRPVVQTAANETEPALSPDGRWLAFLSDETGTTELYVTSMSRPIERWQVSTGGAVRGRWSHDGRELLFYTPQRSLMTASVTASGDTIELGAPVKLFDARLNSFAVAHNGRLVVAKAVPLPPQAIEVVLNWRALVEQTPRG